MVEKINTQKIISPNSSAARINRVNRQDPDARQKGFDRQLQEEDEKNKQREQASHEFEPTEIEDTIEVGKEIYEKDNRDNPDFDKSEGKDGNTQGKLIDILV